MTTVYVTNVTGDGQSPATAYRPAGFDGTPYAVLMIDSRSSKVRALLVSSNDTVTGTGVIKLLTGTSLTDLRNQAASANPTAVQRTAVGSWLAVAGYVALTAIEVSWLDIVHYIARQVNPAADLMQTGV